MYSVVRALSDNLSRSTVTARVRDNAPLLDRVIFHAKATLVYTKGKKRDPSRNHAVALSSLDDVEFNVVDPLKLLLIHALRQGAVKGATTAEEAVGQALARPDGLVQWEYPERPILCSLPGHKFDFTRGARPQQMMATLNEAATLSGIGQRLVTHDLRRGAARDAAHLQPRRSMDNAAEALDHTSTTLDKGVTRRYAGHSAQSTFAGRLSIEASDHFGLQAVSTRSLTDRSKKRKVARADIDEFLRLPENAHLHKLKQPRHAATRAINKRRDAEFANESQVAQQNSAVQLPSLDDVQDKRDTGPPLPLQPWSSSKMNIQPDVQHAVVPMSPTDKDDDAWSNVDPALLLLSGITSKKTTNSGASIDAAMAQSTECMEAVLEELTFEPGLDLVQPTENSCITAAQVELQRLEAPVSEFIPWLSRINTRVVNDTNPAQHADLDHLRGGSRDEPTFFLHHCKHESQGCIFSTTSGPSIKYHEATCTPDRRDTRATKELQMACDFEGCKYIARAETKEELSKKMHRHKRERHVNVAPVMCPIGGRPECAKPFAGSAALSRHKYKVHQPIAPQTFPIEGCRSKQTWENALNLSDHLRKMHLIVGEELADLMGAAKARKSAV